MGVPTSRLERPDLATDLAGFASSVDLDHLEPTVVRAVKANILDTLSCALAGSSAPAIDIVADLVRTWAGARQADMFVFGGRYPAHHAAWVNSAMAHARDYDDTHDAAMLHAGVSVVPAAIAAGQLNPSFTGADLVSAVAVGLELMCRLGLAIKVDITASGFIYSSLLGYFGATAAAGRALGLSSDQMLNAFGIAYSSAAGNHQVTRDASLMKRLQPGLAAQAGVVAAQLAQRGIRGAQHVFEGADGFFRVYLQDRVEPDTVRDELGVRFDLLGLSYKPYPCCRDTHTAVDAIHHIISSQARPAGDVESIRVGVTGPGYQMVCVPEQVRIAPTTVVEAQFSIPYTVAATWVDGSLRMAHFTEDGLKREDILALASRVRPYVHAGIDRVWSRYVTPAAVAVAFRDGTVVEHQVDYPLGHPRHPMSEDAVRAKTADCATHTAIPFPHDAASSLAAAVNALDTATGVSSLVGVLTTPRSA